MKKRFKVLIIFAAVFTVLIGATVVWMLVFSLGKLSDSKTITEGNVSITTTLPFAKQQQVSGLDWFYAYLVDGVGICCTIDTVKELKQESRLEVDNVDEYIELWIESGNYNKLHMYGPYDAGTYKYLEYQGETDGEYISYYAAAYYHDDTYYMINFFCPTTKYNFYKTQFQTWAQSVTFD